MNQPQHADTTAVRLLSDLPAFRHWNNRPLNRQLKHLLIGLDEQTLMSLTAHALQQVTVGPTAPRRLPI